jgi:Flp pilus assembly protein TadD
MVGDTATVRRSLARAHWLIDGGDAEESDAAMAGHCTPAYIRAHEAHCALLLGDSREAVTIYRAVLSDWPDGQRLDEGLFRARLAVALDRTGMVDEADAEGRRALRLGLQTGSRRTITTLGSATSQSSRRRVPASFREARITMTADRRE